MPTALPPLLAVSAGVLGLLVGWAMTAMVDVAAPVDRSARGRGGTAARSSVVAVVTGMAFAVVTWTALTSPATLGVSSSEPLALALVAVAFLSFAAISVALTAIDVGAHRLPNRIVLPSFAVAGVLFAIAAGVQREWDSLLRAAIGMTVLYTFYFVLRLVGRGGMGGGDVKLAGVIGIHLGWVGWGALAVGASAAFLYGGLFGVALLLLRRAGRKTAIPFGPWMILGAWTGVFAGEAVWDWYLGFLTGS
ncbi:prepilin peptidase [Microbacterium kyungheense]|uniref:prepilin peptidase n=1 Tax=Microbacterium kyungheense TaxID=1263636 RepID=UPI001FE7A219|nr:A24 family peptidase [Microbacterium kyungheense]